LFVALYKWSPLARACYAHALQLAARALLNQSAHMLLPLQAVPPYTEYIQVMTCDV
jgi:hypothetical protein